MSDSGRERTCWETPAGTPGRRTSAAPQGQPIRPNLPTHHRFCYDQPEPPQGIRLSAVNPRCGSPCAPGGYHVQNRDGSADDHPGGRCPSGGVRVDPAVTRATSRSPTRAGPEGAAAIFNHPGRVAWWEGPPFGGGQWHAECRGDAKALNAVLADFAKLDVKIKRVVVHDGTGHSFWLAPNQRAGEAGGGEDRLGLHGLAARQLGTAPQAAGRPQPDRARTTPARPRRSTSTPAASAGPT